MAAPVAAADAHRLAALNSPDGEKPLAELSPMKVPAKPGFVPLSPGPEKAKLHMDAVASLLGLSSAEAQRQAAQTLPAKVSTAPEPALEQWTVLPSALPSGPLRAAKRLTSSEIYSRALTLPRSIFESLFGKQTTTATTALVEPSEGALLALAAETTAASGMYSLRAGPLVNALRASAGEILVLTALDAEAAAAGTPPRARASLGYPSDVPTTALAPGTIGTAAAGTTGHDSRSGSGSPGSVDSLTQLTDGEGPDHDDPGAASNAGGYLMDGAGNGAEAGGHHQGGDLPEEGADPEWQQGGDGDGAVGMGLRTRGRPRKRKPFAAVGSGTSQRATVAAVNLSCCHCGTRETPRWWKDAFPLGTLCNACGIWLKRHGYPRPVQFFSVPSATVGGAPGPATTTTADPRAGPQAPSPGDFYLINGRPKRRRAAMNSTYGRGGMEEDGVALAIGANMVAPVVTPQDAAINYQAAGGRVFVMRRKLIIAEVSGTVTAALVHFGWAPGARAAHEMFDKVAGYGSSVVTVEDFELLGDTKATATLTLQPDAEAPADWDAVVRQFVDSL